MKTSRAYLERRLAELGAKRRGRGKAKHYSCGPEINVVPRISRRVRLMGGGLR